ncbi:MAG: DNA gyrase subunit A [Verrucomicrobiales bacterium]
MSDPTNPPPAPQPERIDPISVAEEMKTSFLDYSMSVIISRALPDARDGLKPSQRRILYAMSELGVWPHRKEVKCAKIVGETMGNYHPHGDQAIYPTLVHMAQPWSMRELLIRGQGNFGSVEGDPPASMRYTEAKLAPLGAVLMDDMEKDTVDFVPNYDDTRTEPTVMPSAFPNLLVNGGTGIAVGMATNIPPHNLGEVVDGLCALIDDPSLSIDGLMRHIKGPDFPTGCTIFGLRGVREYFQTGRGSVKVRGKCMVEETRTGREQIIITEIPFSVNRAQLVERIAQLANEKILTEISAVRDESDDKTRVVIDLKRDARAQVIINNLFQHTALETSFSVNMLAIDNRRPRLLSLKDALTVYLEHRREVIIRRTRYLLREAEKDAEKLEAYLLALARLDEFIQIIRDSANRDEARQRLKAYRFTLEAVRALGLLVRGQPSVVGDEYIFTDRQVDQILELRLYQLTALDRQKTKHDYDAILETIKDLMDILAREERVLAIIRDELLTVKEKYATLRRTDFAQQEGEISITDLIANEPAIITMSHRGYIKRTLTSEYRAQNRGGKGLKGMEVRASESEDEPGDFVEHLFTASAHDVLMFFTNTGRVYVERVYQIPEMARVAKGRSIKNMLNLRPEEKIAAVLRIEASVDDDEHGTWREDRFVVFGTRSGVVKKTCLHDFRNVRKDGIIAIRIEEGDDLIGVELTTGGSELIFVTAGGLSLRCSEEDVRDMGRAAVGVYGIRPGGEDYVVSLAVVDPTGMLLVAAENGLGKRTSFEEYRLQSRGGKGIITMNVTEKTGQVVRALVVHQDDDLMLMTSSGQSVRIPVSQIRETGRNAQGVRLIDLREGEKLQDVARVIGEKEEEAAIESVVTQ